MMHQGHGCQGRSPVYPSPALNLPLSNASYNPVSSTWSQAPPIQMPWAFPFHQSDGIVRFSAEPTLVAPQIPLTSLSSWVPADNYSGEWIPRVSKRKPDEDAWVGPARKQLLTEEKMAENMSRLNITSPPPDSDLDGAFERGPSPVKEIAPVDVDYDKLQGPKLILSDEIKSIVADPPLPLSFLENMKMQKPTLAVVLWKPPAGAVNDITFSSDEETARSSTTMNHSVVRNEDEETLEEDFDLDNNNSSSLNLNATARNPTPVGDLEMADELS